MQYKEYGVNQEEVIILLHGGGLSWWNFRKEAELLQKNYHVILPVLNGHAESDHDFTTIEKNAEEIIRFIDEFCNGKILLIGGLSLGAQIVLEILSRRKDIARYAIIESAAVIPDPLTEKMIQPAFSISYGLVKKRWFAKLQFQSLRMKNDFFEEYFRDTCRITKEDLIAFTKASTAYSLKDSLKTTETEVNIFVGQKENQRILKSAKRISELLPKSHMTVLTGLYHGQFSLNHADLYVGELQKIIK